MSDKHEKRPEVLFGPTYEIFTGCGKLFVTLNYLEGVPYEVFMYMGKEGGCASSQAEAIGRLTTQVFIHKGTFDEVIRELRGINCTQRNKDRPSCADALGQILEKERSKTLADSHGDSGTSPSGTE